MIRRILLWAAVAFVIYYVTTDPTGAAHAAESGLGMLKSIAAALTSVISHHGG